MFAFAIWDARRAGCSLARDRLGVKPLYYAELPGTRRRLRLRAQVAARGSRRAARLAPRRHRRVPDAALHPGAGDDLPRHRTSCRPAHVLVAEKGIGPHVALLGSRSSPATAIRGAKSDYLEELDALLRESVALRQISDVPLGAFLSGGIDSTAVVAYMVETSRRPPLTISRRLRSRGATTSWRTRKRVAAHLGCEFHTAHRHARTSLRCCRSWPGTSTSRSPIRPRCRPTTSRRRRASWSRSRCRAMAATSCGPATPATASNAAEQRARADARPDRGPLAGWLGQALPLSVKGARSLRHLG